LKLKAYSNFSLYKETGVVVNGCSSDWSPVTSGIPQGSILELPQGSILEPLLFILYINDLPSAVSSSMKILAEDVATVCIGQF